MLREALANMDFTLLDPIEGLVSEDTPVDIDSLYDELEDVLANLKKLQDQIDSKHKEPALEDLLTDDFLDRLRAGLWTDPPDEPRQGSLFDTRAMNELDALQGLLDRYQLREVPVAVLYDIAETARMDPEIRRNLDRTARKCEKAGLCGGLTREAQAFLFPRAPGRRRREGE